jgi:bifunctional DNase/RNase
MFSTHVRLRLCRGATVVAAAAVFVACSNAEPREIQMEVRSVGFDAGSRAPVVFLQDRDHTVGLPIWVGPAEARAIAMEIEGIEPPRPMTHDLMSSILESTGVDLNKVVIESLRDGTYYARVHLDARNEKLALDARPSDAIALALRLQRPIFASTALLRGENSVALRGRAEEEGSIRLAGVTVQDLSAELADLFGVPAGAGVVVSAVARGAFDGLQRGDVILEVNGDTVTSARDFEAKFLDAGRQGDAVLSVRRNDERFDVRVRTGG